LEVFVGHSQLNKQRTHARIVDIASRRLREEGLEGIGVADLMKEAGLTVGGFYKHFASRDELVAEAIDAAFKGYEQRLEARGIVPADLPLEEMLNAYLSVSHRDNPGEGCPFTALGGDLARSDSRTRQVATERFRRNTELMSGRMKDADAATARKKALLALCAMAGAVEFARLVDDEALSEEILATVRDELLKMAAVGTPPAQ
jgi:TetR/AcrR family transcriptional regulator, transcriptional repressor for nem operon